MRPAGKPFVSDRRLTCHYRCMHRLALLLVAAPAWPQTADAILAAARSARWEQPYVARASCRTRQPVQMDLYATMQWTHHCVESSGGIVRESFYYVFGEPARTALLRLDLRPETGATLDQLRAVLTRRFGAPDHAPQLMEIGFRRLRYGEPVAGDHWKGGPAHYFLHANQSHSAPLGMRTGVQLIVLHERLFEERRRDDLILKVDGIGSAGPPPGRAPDPIALLREASRSGREERARLLLEAHTAVHRLAGTTADAQAGPLRRSLARYGVKVGGELHYGGLDYRGDLLWRVWREFPDTEAGERAFVELQQRGWSTDNAIGCPTHPDYFRTVIDKGEAFLAARPESRWRKEVVHTVAVAYESWWSIARAPADDGIVAHIPYTRRAANAREAERARLRAIEYYRELVRIAPDSPEAAAAQRRLPRLELGLDTGQRRFFCSYC